MWVGDELTAVQGADTLAFGPIYSVPSVHGKMDLESSHS